MTLPQHLWSVNSFAGENALNTVFVSVLDRLLMLLEDPTVKTTWPTNPKRSTALAFELFEEWHCITLQWLEGHGSTMSMIAEAVPDDPHRGTLCALNPTMSSISQSQLYQHACDAWALRASDRLGRRFPSDVVMHPSSPMRDFLFSSAASAKSTSSTGRSLLISAPAPAPGLAALAPPAPAPSPALFPAHRPATAQKGEPSLKPVTPRTAMKPLFKWKDPNKTTKFGKLIVDLHKAGSKNPLVKIDCGDAGVKEKPVCFAFITAPAADLQGCDGTMYVGKGAAARKCKACDRVHIDLGDPAWAKLGKEGYSQLWKFLQHDVVKDLLAAADDFHAIMA